jgi:hypothetical protein
MWRWAVILPEVELLTPYGEQKDMVQQPIIA